MDAMSAPSEAGSATAAALKFERRAEEFEIKRFAGLTGFQSAREVAKLQQRAAAEEKKRIEEEARADDLWQVEYYVFFSVFALYALTTAPSVAGGDSGELLAESCSLGTAHPPGYPLFTLLYHIPLTYMPIYFSPALWANLFTAVLGAGASAVVCAITREALRCGGQCGRSITGAAAGYLFAFSPLVWQYHCTSEVFALNNLLVALLVHRALLYARLRKVKDLRIAALLTGLALSNQHTAVLFVVPLGARALSIASVQLRKRPRELIILGLYGLLGLSPYAYLPLSTPKAGGWGHVRSLRGFMHHFLRRDYGTLRLYSGRVGSGEGLDERIWAWYASVSFVQGPLPYALPVLALLGACLLLYLPQPQQELCDDASSQGGGKKSAKARRRARVQEYNQQRRAEKGSTKKIRVAARGCRESLALLVGALGFYLLAFHALSNLPLSDPLLYGIHARFWMQPHLALCCLAGLGIEGIVRICGRRGIPIIVVIIALQIRVGLEPSGLSPGAPGGLYSRRIGLHTAHPAHFFGDYARALLKTLPQNALLLINYDQQWTC